MTDLIPLKNGLPSFCEVYGHFWRPLNRHAGIYKCVHCKQTGYCSACLLTIPRNVLVLRCDQHEEKPHE